TRNWLMLMFGVVLAAALAILLDSLIGMVQKAVEERRRTLGMFAMSALLLVCIGGLLSPRIATWMRPVALAPIATSDRDKTDGAERPVIRIGSKTFTEQYILASLLEDVLRDAGFQ